MRNANCYNFSLSCLQIYTLYVKIYGQFKLTMWKRKSKPDIQKSIENLQRNFGSKTTSGTANGHTHEKKSAEQIETSSFRAVDGLCFFRMIIFKGHLR